MSDIAPEIMLDIYQRILKIRRFEEEVGLLFKNGQLPGLVHLYIGEEAVGAGVCAALRNDDYITSTHRGHGHVIAKGGDLNRMMGNCSAKPPAIARVKVVASTSPISRSVCWEPAALWAAAFRLRWARA
jgi:TPP-dependent pyruvate/acetoin dehydrogenase alpha subunit